MSKKQTIDNLLTKKQYGDLAEVAELMETTRYNVGMILRRPNARRHEEAVALLADIINTREERKQKITKDNENN